MEFFKINLLCVGAAVAYGIVQKPGDHPRVRGVFFYRSSPDAGATHDSNFLALPTRIMKHFRAA